MTTTKDYIRKTSWFTSNGLTDPRLEAGAESRLPALNLEYYFERIRKSIEAVNLPGRRKEILNR